MTYDLLAGALTLATLVVIGRRLFDWLDARFEVDRPRWEPMRAAAGEGYVAPNHQRVRVVAGPVDWDERGWA